jgi:hypothetical protein
MNNLVGDAERLIKLNKVTEGVRCITTAAALVALVQNEKQAMYLLDSVIPLPAFKEHELMIRNEFKEGKSFYNKFFTYKYNQIWTQCSL